MRTLRVLLGTALAAAPVGCGSAPATAPAETPLTVEQWKTLQAETKYEVETLERLKQANPKLQDQREWTSSPATCCSRPRRRNSPTGSPDKNPHPNLCNP